MSRWLAFLVALLVMGCEDTYVREHIIDNFVCVYMPWWMGECDGDEVTAKVMGVLDHGLTEAHASCSVVWGPPWSSAYTETISVHALVDGSKLWTSTTSQVSNYTQFCARGEPCGDAASWSLTKTQNVNNVCTFALQDGLFTISCDGGDINSYMSHTPHTFVSEDITEVCTGFNLEAFGVE